MDTTTLSSSLRSVISALHKGLRKQMSSVSTYSMTEIETIGQLARATTLLPTELAAHTRVTTQTMSQILKKMEQEGVIKRTPSKDDKRKVFISLTSFGKKMVEKAKYDKDEWLKNSIDRHLSDKEKDQLIRTLPILNKLLETK
jgi:DNA-binding MarR family transcriptional regulator